VNDKSATAQHPFGFVDSKQLFHLYLADQVHVDHIKAYNHYIKISQLKARKEQKKNEIQRSSASPCSLAASSIRIFGPACPGSEARNFITPRHYC
jgi:hypothetical protein